MRHQRLNDIAAFVDHLPRPLRHKGCHTLEENQLISSAVTPLAAAPLLLS